VQDFVGARLKTKNYMQCAVNTEHNITSTLSFLIHPAKRKTKTYNSGDSLVVTHLTTNPPVSCLNRAERTGSLAFTHATATKALNFPVCGNLNGLALFLNAVY
jgi:hypothetical protein